MLTYTIDACAIQKLRQSGSLSFLFRNLTE